MQSSKQLLTELCGFSTIVIGTFLLNATKDWDASAALMPPGRSGAPFNAMRPVHDDPEIQTISKTAGVGRLSAAFSRESLLMHQDQHNPNQLLLASHSFSQYRFAEDWEKAFTLLIVKDMHKHAS